MDVSPSIYMVILSCLLLSLDLWHCKSYWVLFFLNTYYTTICMTTTFYTMNTILDSMNLAEYPCLGPFVFAFFGARYLSLWQVPLSFLWLSSFTVTSFSFISRILFFNSCKTFFTCWYVVLHMDVSSTTIAASYDKSPCRSSNEQPHEKHALLSDSSSILANLGYLFKINRWGNS